MIAVQGEKSGPEAPLELDREKRGRPSPGSAAAGVKGGRGDTAEQGGPGTEAAGYV